MNSDVNQPGRLSARILRLRTLSRTRPVLMGSLTFLASAIASVWLIAYLASIQLDRKRSEVSDQAGIYAADIQQRIERALSATYALGALVRQGRGDVPAFEAIASEMLPFYPGVASLQLAPGGVVKHVVPIEANKSIIGHDLFQDAGRNTEAIKARDTGLLTLAGPYELLQGGFGAIGRLPIYLDDADGKPVFWGFTSALLKFPEVLAGVGLDQLRARGYAYELFRIHPDTRISQTVIASDTALLDHPIQHAITLPNGQWILSVAPIAGWQDYREWITRFGLGLLFSGLLGSLVASRTRSLSRLRLTEQILRERQVIEAELQRRTFLLESAQREARIGYFVTELQTGRWTGSPMLDQIMGIDDRYPRNVETWAELVHADDRQQALREFDQAIRRQENLHHRYRIVRPMDGAVCWVDAWGSLERENGQPVRLIGTVKDITETTLARLELERHRDQLEQRVEERTQALSAKTQELERATERLQLAMEGTRLGIWEWHLPSRDLSWSVATGDILGYERGKLENSLDGWLSLLPNEEREQVLADKLSALEDSDFCELDYRLRASDGSYRWVHDRGRVTRRGPLGQPERVVGTIQDITPRKQAELDLQESELRYRVLAASLEDKVAERTAQLAAASAAKTQFLAHMSHEIRTPMNAVLGLAQLLAQEPLSPGQAAMVRHIGEAGDSLLRIINDILDLSKIEADQIVIEHQPFTLAPLLERIDNLFRHAAASKGLAWAVTAPPDCPALLGDAHRIEQILINLVGNALKFTAAGSVRLTTTVLAADDRQARLRVEVRDSGIGMSEATLNRLFQPFSQGDASITRRFGGTGLGLTISKRLVELMGGELRVSSQEGQGSTFAFEIPFQRAEATPGPAPTGPKTTQLVTLSLSGLRVLAVDDNRINLLIAEKALKNQGARVTTAADGQQALDALKASPEDFDVVLMDIQMPVMDGLTATREIRRDPDLAALPVVGLSAGVLPEEREAALTAGMQDFLTKPINLEAMTSTLLRVTGAKTRDPHPIDPPA